MPRVSIDTTEATSFEAVEPGPYPMTVETAEVKNAATTGTPMLNVGFTFEDPQTAKKAGKIFRNYMLGGKGAGFARDFLKAFGIDIPIGGVFDFDTDEIIGRHVLVQVTNKEYEGKLQNEAQSVVAA
jgi:hypothetical protein